MREQDGLDPDHCLGMQSAFLSQNAPEIANYSRVAAPSFVNGDRETLVADSDKAKAKSENEWEDATPEILAKNAVESPEPVRQKPVHLEDCAGRRFNIPFEYCKLEVSSF